MMKTAFFPAKTLTNLPADTYEALAALCTEYERFDGHARQMPEQHDDYVEALGILRAFASARDATLAPFPEIGAQRHQNIANISAYFGQLRTHVRTELTGRHSRGYFETKTAEYLALFSKAQVYEFAETDFKRVHELADELKALIRESSLLPDEHKRRLLRRLEAMRAELHRRTNDIDRFWGFLGEAGIVIRKFGQDLRPISERVMDLGDIVLGVILSTEGITTLPEISQLLSDRGD